MNYLKPGPWEIWTVAMSTLCLGVGREIPIICYFAMGPREAPLSQMTAGTHTGMRSLTLFFLIKK